MPEVLELSQQEVFSDQNGHPVIEYDFLCQRCHSFFQSNLQVLMDGLKSFISEQNKANLEAALTRLKEDLMLDASKINQLSTALWIFQVLVGIT